MVKFDISEYQVSTWEAVPAGRGFHLTKAALLSTPEGATLVPAQIP